MVTLTIDGRTVSVPEGTTILEAAQTLRISIPTLCYLKDINEIGACRICMVEVEGYARLVPSCDSAVSEGMVVYTSSPRVREARRVNLRLLLSQHETKCTKCTRSGNCKLQQLTNDYNLLGDHYIDDLKNIPTDYSNPVVRIENRCVKCMRCIQVCEKIQGMGIWDLMGTGTRTTVGVAHTRTLGESDCTFCGQCITHCPVGGLQEHDDTGKVFDALANKDRITVVQVAPAVRAAWAEFYHLDPKFATAERMVTALKTMGFDYVFDTDFAADLTIMEEGSEFIERFTHRNKYHWPMFTSCCPGWVRFLKGQFPSYTENLSTAKSPQQMFGAVAKSYFAQKIGVDPKKLFVVSIMPCTAKKAECALPTMKDEQGDQDVDVVLTTREIVRMLRGEQINPAVLPETPFDSPLGTGTGAAVVFGATGGVMDAALRSAYYLITGKEPKPDAFSAVRGMDSWKEAVFTIPGAGNVRVAVVSGLFTLIFVFSNTAAVGWGWRLVEGAVDLLFGVVMLAHPLLSASLIPVIVGIWVFIRGLMYLIDALKWRRSRARERSGYAVIGVLLMVLGFLMVIDDRFGLIPVAYLLAAIFLFLGFAGLTVAFGMRRIQRDAEA